MATGHPSPHAAQDRRCPYCARRPTECSLDIRLCVRTALWRPAISHCVRDRPSGVLRKQCLLVCLGRLGATSHPSPHAAQDRRCAYCARRPTECSLDIRLSNHEGSHHHHFSRTKNTPQGGVFVMAERVGFTPLSRHFNNVQGHMGHIRTNSIGVCRSKLPHEVSPEKSAYRCGY